ncbi:hypothetical protein Droror1_Dr00016511, partial [Drosera rotundifolia]
SALRGAAWPVGSLLGLTGRCQARCPAGGRRQSCCQLKKAAGEVRQWLWWPDEGSAMRSLRGFFLFVGDSPRLAFGLPRAEDGSGGSGGEQESEDSLRASPMPAVG